MLYKYFALITSCTVVILWHTHWSLLKRLLKIQGRGGGGGGGGGVEAEMYKENSCPLQSSNVIRIHAL